jgi:hypothetical protein
MNRCVVGLSGNFVVALVMVIAPQSLSSEVAVECQSRSGKLTALA